MTSLGNCADSTATPAAVDQNAPTAVVTPGAAKPGCEAPGVNPPCATAPLELGGRGGLEPTRYGDWEMRGRCIDF